MCRNFIFRTLVLRVKKLDKTIEKMLNKLTNYNCSWDKKSQYYLGEFDFGVRCYFNVDWRLHLVEVMNVEGVSSEYSFSDFVDEVEELVAEIKSEIKLTNSFLPKRQEKSNPYSLTNEDRKLYNIDDRC